MRWIRRRRREWQDHVDEMDNNRTPEGGQNRKTRDSTTAGEDYPNVGMRIGREHPKNKNKQPKKATVLGETGLKSPRKKKKKKKRKICSRERNME